MMTYWRIVLNTNNKRKADALAAELSLLMGGVIGKKIVPYWKDQEKYLFEGRCLSNGSFGAEVVWNSMVLAERIAYSWETIFSHRNEKEFELSGVAKSGFKMSGIDWASFVVAKGNDD